MNSFIETLNQWGGNFLSFAWPMLWQSSLLIVVLLAFDFLFRRKLRASIRYALWLVVLVKLCVPPTLALPTSPAWWLQKTPPPIAAKAEPHYTVTYDNGPLSEIPQASLPVFVPPKPTMMNSAWLLIASAAVSSALLGWLLVRWWQITRQVRRAATSERLAALADEAQKFVGMKFKVQVKLTANSMSPAVCGLFRPAILIPQSLVENFSDEQLRAVLLHELIHLRRRDVWLNFFQALLQIVYWWHPLVWLANARIRRVREEAVDDAVMLALRDEAETYAPTLLEVAKLALNRPLASLGLVGILESRHALRQRIERLVDFRPPRQAGLTLVSLLGILAFTAIAVPMGEAPAAMRQQTNIVVSPPILTNTAINARATSPSNPDIFTPLSQTNFDQLLKDGKSFYEMGKLDEAMGKFARASIADPSNTNTQYYISLIVHQRIEKSGKSPFGRQDITKKLHSIRLDQVAFAATPLSEVLRNLAKQAKSNDPEKQGVNFLINPNSDSSDNAGGFAFNGSGQTNWTVVSLITIDPPLTNAPLGDVLDAVVRYASEPIYYSVQDYAVVFWSGKPSQPLEPRIFKVDTNIFPAALLQQAAQSGFLLPDDTVNRFGLAFRHLSAAAGVNWYAPGKQVIYNDKAGSIYVNATAEDLRVLRQLVAALSKNKPALQSFTNPPALFARSFKVDPNTFPASLRKQAGLQTDSASGVALAVRNFFSKLGVDLESPKGKTVFYGDRLGVLYVKATASDLDTIERAIQALNYTPPYVHIKARFVEVTQHDSKDLGFDWYLGQFNGSNNVAGKGGGSPSLTVPVSASNPRGVFSGNTASSVVAPAVATISGILSEPNFRVVLHALEQRDGVKSLAEPDVTTMSGRQTQMRATQIINVVTNFALQENGTNVSVFPQTEKVETGPVLDTVAYVLSDGYTINLTTIASVTEFLGYDKTTNSTVALNAAGEKVDLPVALPRIDVRQASANLNFYDGQTVVLGKLRGEVTVGGKKVDARQNVEDKLVLVFITVTLVDPTGNRIHVDEELPFAQKGIPPQPPQPK